jgi:dipeptidyl aminopeptidase/acylaminoacyl peptidase
MPEPRVAPYGAWPSPVTAEAIVAGQVEIGQIAIDGQDLWWIEGRPAEGGRNALVRRDGRGRITDLLPPPWSARTRAHEYGGGSFAVDEGRALFANGSDQRLYAVRPGEAPRAITPEGPWRFADGVIDRGRRRLIAVREDHSAGSAAPVNSLVAVPLDGGSAGTVIVSGHDFYSNPRVSPDGRRLAWLAWSHPHMPWDETELWIGDLHADGAIGDARRIAGGTGESVFQPQWSPDGVLHLVSDRTGWWNLYRFAAGEMRALAPRAAEFGVPQWAFGASTYAFASATTLVCAYCRSGIWSLATLDLVSGAWRERSTQYVAFSSLRAASGRAFAVAAARTESPALVEIDLETDACRVLRRSSSIDLDPSSIAVAEPIEFSTADGETAHAFFYPPRSRDAVAAPEERPPLRVRSHGGPTSASDPSLKLGIQYWTTRGFAVLDVNYRGSTGYGRAYRERLRGVWGIADVDDCVNGALALAARGRVDRERLTISGGSAGGFTTLCALTFRDVFRAGASHYGVADLAALARDTHKFEARYLDSLVAPWPEGEAIYRERSPLFHTEGLSCPVVFFQGLDDRVVLPDQSEEMVAALRRKRLPVAYLAFPGEAHGFRKAETIRRVLEAELAFFARILGFTPAEPLPALEIENL